MADSNIAEMVAEIVGAYVSNNKIEASSLPSLIQSVYSSLSTVDEPAAPVKEPVTKATSAQIKKSITPDALISFVDGRPYKTLKRHLATHGLTLNEYTSKFGLPRDYPSTAPAYSERRSAMAKAAGLGARGRSAASAPAPGKAPARRAKKADAASAV